MYFLCIVFNAQIGSDFSSSSYIERIALCVYDFHKIYANSFEDDQKLTVLDFPAPKNQVRNRRRSVRFRDEICPLILMHWSLPASVSEMKLLSSWPEKKHPAETEKCVFSLVNRASRTFCILSINTDKLWHQGGDGRISSCSTYAGPQSAVVSFRKPREPKQKDEHQEHK